MSRDELIAALAAQLHEQQTGVAYAYCPTCLDRAEKLLPLFVNFVDAWLLNYWPAGSSDTDDMAERWREEMH